MIQNLNAMDSTPDHIGAQIIEAGATGNVKKLKEIRKKIGEREFRKTCDLYRDQPLGRTVLHHAAETGRFDVCRFLIMDVTVYVDAMTYRRNTPLMEATKEEHVQIVNYLMYEGAEVTMANSKGYTALHYAVLRDNRELMHSLVCKGAYLDADSVDGTPLQMASSRRKVQALKFLLSHGAKPNFYFLRLENPLVCAIKYRSFECMKVLLKAKADPNRYFMGFSPLSYAAIEGDTIYLKALLDAGADPNSYLTGLMKPIEYAGLAHNREGVEMLFPLTRPIQGYQIWSVDGIMGFCHSEAAKKLREKKRRDFLIDLDKRTQDAMRKKDYRSALACFEAQSLLDPSNPKWASLRSMYHAHAGRRSFAMHDAEESLTLQTPTNFAINDSTAHVLKKFVVAGLAFTLDPNNAEAAEAFSVAFFDRFASLFLTATPQEILRFTQL